MAGFVLNARLKVQLLTTAPSDFDAPTQAELTAGVDLVGTEQTEELVGINGWEEQADAVPTGGYASLRVGSLTGPSSYPQSSLTWRKDSTSTTIYSAVAKGSATKWVYFMPDGQSSGEEAFGFPVTIDNRRRSLAPAEAHTFTADFSLTPPYEATQAA